MTCCICCSFLQLYYCTGNNRTALILNTLPYHTLYYEYVNKLYKKFESKKFKCSDLVAPNLKFRYDRLTAQKKISKIFLRSYDQSGFSLLAEI